MIKSSCQLKMKAVFLSLLLLSVVVCNPFHLKDEQGKNYLLVWYCFGCTVRLIHINTLAIFKSVTKRLKMKSDWTLTSLKSVRRWSSARRLFCTYLHCNDNANVTTKAFVFSRLFSNHVLNWFANKWAVNLSPSFYLNTALLNVLLERESKC